MPDVDCSSRLLISASRRLLMFGTAIYFYLFDLKFLFCFISFDGTHVMFISFAEF
jgi:hypothetical protein